MGRLRFKSPNKNSKMKFAALIATAAASPTQFVVDNWWNEAQNVFNFAQTNWQQFASAADSVGDNYWQPLWNFCNADSDAEITSDELTHCAKTAAEYVRIYPRIPLPIRCQILELGRPRRIRRFELR